MSTANKPLVGVVMGSSSDWDVMQHAVAILKEFGVAHEAQVLSAHRMPDQMFDYAKAARERGLRAIIADTKFEFGLDENGVLHLMDEVLTADSSRFWPADSYAPGGSPPSFDKQFVRDYLETLKDWNKTAPAPALPADVIEKTGAKYREALYRLTGHHLKD